MAQGVVGSVWCGGLVRVWGRNLGRTSRRQAEEDRDLPGCFRDTKQTEHRAQLLQSPREVKVPSLALPRFPTSVRQNLLESGLAM